MIRDINEKAIKELPARPGVREDLIEFCYYLIELVPKINQIYVFGSQARGDWNEDSDIDLFITVDPSLGIEYIQSYIEDFAIDFSLKKDNFIVFPKVAYGFVTKEVGFSQFYDIFSVAFLNNVETQGVKIYESK